MLLRILPRAAVLQICMQMEMVLFSAPLHLFGQALRQRSAALGWIYSWSPSHASLKKTHRTRARIPAIRTLCLTLHRSSDWPWQ